MSWTYKISNRPNPLTQSEMEGNAEEIYGQLYNYGWTVNAICGVLGNMQWESYINPAQTQNYHEINYTSGGYGLVMWTPASNITEWLRANNHSLFSGYWQVYAVANEPNGQQYYPTGEYNLSYEEFKHSGMSPADLASAFMKNYERPRASDAHEQERRDYADDWYRYLMGTEPPEPSPTPPQPPDPPIPPSPDPSGYKGKGLQIWMMVRYI